MDWRKLILLGASLAFWAQGAQFDEIEISGACDKRRTHIIENGGSLSVLFDDFNANMPANQVGDGNHVHKICNFRIRLSFPRDAYLSNLRQVYSGGVIKSRLANGFFRILYRLGPKVSELTQLPFRVGSTITAESPRSLFTKTFDDPIPQPKNCKGELRFDTRVALEAKRPNQKEYFIGGLDSLDAELIQRLDLIPTWKACVKAAGRR